MWCFIYVTEGITTTHVFLSANIWSKAISINQNLIVLDKTLRPQDYNCHLQTLLWVWLVASWVWHWRENSNFDSIVCNCLKSHRQCLLSFTLRSTLLLHFKFQCILSSVTKADIQCMFKGHKTASLKSVKFKLNGFVEWLPHTSIYEVFISFPFWL